MIERSGSKNVGLIIPGTNNDRILKIAPGDNIPSAGLKYKEQIEMALIGNTVKPKKLVVAFSGVDHAEIDDALNALADENVSYAAVSAQTDTVASKVVSWVKEQREIGKNIKAVLPENTADNEAVINFSTESVSIVDKSYTAEQFCARMAGLFAGTPITESATYAVLPEATDCTRMSKKRWIQQLMQEN